MRPYSTGQVEIRTLPRSEQKSLQPVLCFVLHSRLGPALNWVGSTSTTRNESSIRSHSLHSHRMVQPSRIPPPPGFSPRIRVPATRRYWCNLHTPSTPMLVRQMTTHTCSSTATTVIR